MPLPYGNPPQDAPPKPKPKRVRKPKGGFDPASAAPRKPRQPTSNLKDPTKIAAASKPPGGAPRLEQVVCRTKHCINGQDFGPGLVTVREDVAALLREQERRVVEGELRFYGRQAFLVGPGLKPREVPYETFEDTAHNAPEIGTATKGGGWSENK